MLDSPSSYELINYSLRPAKSVERKMIIETLRRLDQIASLTSYRYIGFGSPFFSDFILVHKQLGINNMVSIERDEHNRDRFEFNKPFGAIQLVFNESSTALPRLKWDIRTIVWLDYDDVLTRNILADVEFVTSSIPSGSILIITVNAHPFREASRRLEKFTASVGKAHVPLGTRNRDFARWGTATLSHSCILTKIHDTLGNRSAALRPENHFHFRQLFDFTYADGARMLTVGGVIYDEGQRGLVARADFDALPFTRSEEQESYRIEVPPLTFREMRKLDAQLPIADPADLEMPDIPADQLRQYSDIYRFFPSFVDAEF